MGWHDIPIVQTAEKSCAVTDDGLPTTLWRTICGFVGGYALTSGFVALAGSALPLVGIVRSEAVSLAALLALFVYVPACLAMFVTRRPIRDGVTLLTLAVTAIAAASAI